MRCIIVNALLLGCALKTRNVEKISVQNYIKFILSKYTTSNNLNETIFGFSGHDPAKT